MKLAVVLKLFLLLGVCVEGLPALILTHQTVEAAAGRQAQLTCSLLQSEDVRRVTWKKVSPGRKKKHIAFLTSFATWVDKSFRGRLELIEAGLKNFSIVLSQVEQQDEGCYQCVFHIYPFRDLTGTTCLKVYELHEPVLHIIESNSPEDSVVSCSATGRPAPTVTLNVSQQPDLHFYNYSTVSVTNTNGTVTVTTAAMLSGYHGDATEVSCAVRLLSVPEVQVFQKIPAVKQSSADGDDEPASNDKLIRIIRSSLVVGVAVAAVVSIFLLLYRYKPNNSLSHRDPENIRMLQIQLETLLNSNQRTSSSGNDHLQKKLQKRRQNCHLPCEENSFTNYNQTVI